VVLFIASWIRGKNIPSCPYRCDNSGVSSTRVPTDKPDKKQKQNDEQNGGTNDDTNEGSFMFEEWIDVAEVEGDVEVDEADIDVD
jgi:hypothetical protein